MKAGGSNKEEDLGFLREALQEKEGGKPPCLKKTNINDEERSLEQRIKGVEKP